MPSCKYCNEPMARKNDLKVSFYMCPKCGARGPSVKMDRIGWQEELDAKTLGQSIEVKAPSAEDDLRKRNAALSARCSRLKACELPNNAKLERDVNDRIRNLQANRRELNKYAYLRDLAHLYKQKATFLEYKTGFEKEFAELRQQIRENKMKLKGLAELKKNEFVENKRRSNEPLGRAPTQSERSSPNAKWCQYCIADCVLRESDHVAMCDHFKPKS